MPPAHQIIRRSPLPLLLLLFVFRLAVPEVSLATDLPIYGGLGGNEDRAQCPQGWYLVGLSGNTGSWVDRVAPICAPWLPAKLTFGPTSIGPSFGMSTGGGYRDPKCTGSGNNTHAIQSWWIHVLRSDDHYVQYVEMFCASLTAPVLANSGRRLSFGEHPNDIEEMVTGGPFAFGSQPPFQGCAAGEAAVGFRVRAGRYVDAIGLICGPIPLKVAPATKLPGPLTQAPSSTVTMNPQAKNMKIAADMFVITKPVPGQLIPHGKLIIIATAPEAPPTVGPPRYAELELRCLEAPSNLQFSSPYFQVITVEEAKLRRGYAVDQRVTGACSGGWQVRARFSLNASTGPWSAAVPFQLCFNHCPGTPPSAIQQTAPSPSSSVMQSAPSLQKSTSSSLMIRPRGVDEKGGEQGTKMVDMPPQMEKKP